MMFRDLKFGLASATQESARQPELLLDGFLDNEGIIEKARNGDRYLFLGPKGSGKTAIGEHLRLLAESDSNLFVQNIFIEDMPFSDLSRIVKGHIAPESKYPTAWSWLLLLYLFGSFFEDEGSPSRFDDDFNDALEVIMDLGLLPTPTLQQIVRTSSKASFKITVPAKLVSLESGYERSEQPQDIAIPFFVDRLKAIACKFKSDSMHLLVIDGLDDILTHKKVQYDSLAALIFEVSRLNSVFFRSGTPAKIILLCRVDLYEKLPGPNKNKIRQDSAEILDWYQNTRTPMESNLIKLINHKARVNNPNIADVFSQYFLPLIPRNHGNEEDIRSFLLSWTRHTPRDLIRLMSSIQKFCKSEIVEEGYLWEGIRWYSIDYFLPEIKDELAGYFLPEEIELIVSLLISVKSRVFSFSSIASSANRNPQFKNLDLPKVLNALFDCGAIENIFGRGGGQRYSCKYRNRESVLDINEEMAFHKGLWKAMNL